MPGHLPMREFQFFFFRHVQFCRDRRKFAELQKVATDLQGTGNALACSDLSLFISHVKAQALKQLNAAQAQQMLVGTAQIGATIGCP